MNTFHRVSQVLRADTGVRSVSTLLIAFSLLAVWMVWAVKAKVARYEVSDAARLEVVGAAYAVQANVAGQLIRSQLALGKEVQSGSVLAELDSEEERLSLRQELAHLGSLEPQLQALRSQMQAEGAGRTDERHVLTLSTDAAQSQYREAEAQARLSEQEAERDRKLHSEGILSDADMQRAQAEAQSRRSAADALKVAISRLEPELQVRETDREVRLRQIQEDIAKVETEIATSRAAIDRLQFEIGRRVIRAPISGRLGECAALRPGAHINEGQQLGVILPSEHLQVVAEFEPRAALGKVRAGQSATVRLQGFPWAQYGTIQAKVARVASDIRDGKVRVELAVLEGEHSRIPFQHGLPGTVEVEVERVSPAMLVMRSAGQFAGAH